MANQYVNKVVQSDGTTLIDITDTTATAADVAVGKYFYNAAGAKTEGTNSGSGTAAISVVDTTDSAGGTIRTITALDISDTTAEAADVAQGKYFYTADGTKTAGTSSGGGGGLEYETGTFSPTEDVAQPTINFANTHSDMPFLVMMSDVTGTASEYENTNLGFTYYEYYALTGYSLPYNSASTIRSGYVSWQYHTTGTTTNISVSGTNLTYNSDDTGSSSSYYPRYWVTETNFKPHSNSTSRYWRAGRTYKWIALWKPQS